MQALAQTCETGSVTLHCSEDMLAGSTGCYPWPAGMCLAQYVLSHAAEFKGKCCLELGCGVGLLGVCLARTGATQVCDTSHLL